MLDLLTHPHTIATLTGALLGAGVAYYAYQAGYTQGRHAERVHFLTCFLRYREEQETTTTNQQ